MSEHPYSQYKKTLNWKILEKAIQDLADNQDLIENTDRSYIGVRVAMERKVALRN